MFPPTALADAVGAAARVDSSTIDAALLQASRLVRKGRPAADSATLQTALAHLARDWPGVVAASLLVAAWELPTAPAFSDIPDAHWGAYADWLLACPAAPADAAQARAIARHLAHRVAEIADWMDRNLAAAPVRAIAEACQRAPVPPLALFPHRERLALQLARARVLQRLHGRSATGVARTPVRRAGRRLRVGFLRRRHVLDAAGCALLARITHLDTNRFEPRLYALEADWSTTADLFRDRAQDLVVLPDTLPARLETLRTDQLDVLVFAEDLSAHAWPLAHLALHRIAPLQMLDAPEGVTSGLAAIDLRLVGELDAALSADASERLAVVPGTSHAHDLDLLRPAPGAGPTRADLGLPEDAPLLLVSVSTAPLAAADRERVARALATHPAARLLLAAESPDATDARVALRDMLVAAGAPGIRIHIANTLDSFIEPAGLVALADLCLAPSPFVAALALDAGRPSLVLADSAAAALYRAAGLDSDLIPDEDSWECALDRLLASPAERDAARERILAGCATLPGFADTYGAAQDFAAVLETAWDELVALGAGRFRRQREPVRTLTPHSAHPGDLQAEARALVSNGRAARAVPCLLSAIQRSGEDATLWFDLACAYRAAGNSHAALESLEASLRLDAGNAAGWILICELAIEVGSMDFAREALDLAVSLRPDDERLPALRARVAA